MSDFKNPKLYLRAVLGGGVTGVIGGILLPYANTYITFIPQIKLLLEGLTPHFLVAYGVGYLIADKINMKLIKM